MTFAVDDRLEYVGEPGLIIPGSCVVREADPGARDGLSYAVEQNSTIAWVAESDLKRPSAPDNPGGVRIKPGVTVWTPEGGSRGPDSIPNNDPQPTPPSFSGSLSERLDKVHTNMSTLAEEIERLRDEVDGDLPTPYGVCARCFKDVQFVFRTREWDHLAFPDDPHAVTAVLPTEGPPS